MIEHQQRILQANLRSKQRQQEKARERARAALPPLPTRPLQPTEEKVSSVQYGASPSLPAKPLQSTVNQTSSHEECIRALIQCVQELKLEIVAEQQRAKTIQQTNFKSAAPYSRVTDYTHLLRPPMTHNKLSDPSSTRRQYLALLPSSQGCKVSNLLHCRQRRNDGKPKLPSRSRQLSVAIGPNTASNAPSLAGVASQGHWPGSRVGHGEEGARREGVEEKWVTLS